MFNPMHALTFFKYVYHLVQRIIGEKVETKTRWLTGDVIWLCLIQISLWFCFSVIYRFNTLVTFSTFVNKCFYTCDQLLNLCLQHTGTTYSTLFYTFFFAVILHPYNVKFPSFTFYRENVLGVSVRFCHCRSFSSWWLLPSISHILTAAIKFPCLFCNEIRLFCFFNLSP